MIEWGFERVKEETGREKDGGKGYEEKGGMEGMIRCDRKKLVKLKDRMREEKEREKEVRELWRQELEERKNKEEKRDMQRMIR